jgi:hypothetical protein
MMSVWSTATARIFDLFVRVRNKTITERNVAIALRHREAPENQRM